MDYRFHVQRIGPVKLVLGGLLVAGLLLGAVLFASAVAIIGLIAGLVVSAAALLGYGVRRFLNPRQEAEMERRAEGIVVIERTDLPGVRTIEVELIDDGQEVPRRPRD
ncbi:MAG: hypothetical protein DVB23_001117 [Verrucomicrobia bacterium]|jgi:uncharacterized protein (DUF58 family)|nr:MAG: hypothetical protein DVB23_001117 [Verrucomicrobiota bacterium]